MPQAPVVSCSTRVVKGVGRRPRVSGPDRGASHQDRPILATMPVARSSADFSSPAERQNTIRAGRLLVMQAGLAAEEGDLARSLTVIGPAAGPGRRRMSRGGLVVVRCSGGRDRG